MRTRSRRFVAVHSGLALAFAATVAVVGPSPAAAAGSELFFSEYIEGSSNNKALEIYNGTGGAVDLVAGDYNVQMYFNGSTSPGATFSLAGTVAPGDVFVLAHSAASPGIVAQADQISGAGFFNGNDAVALRKGTTIIDVIGQIGFNPGAEWGTGLISTANNTLRRASAVCAGDPDGSDAFDPTFEWDGFAQDTFDGLGAHTASCGGSAKPVINEFSASTTGADVEYVEILGSPSTDYSSYTVLEIEGDGSPASGTVDEVIPVGTTGADGRWLQDLAANSLENGSLTLLLVKDFFGAVNDDLDVDDDGVLDVTPWASVVDAVAVNDGGAADRAYGAPVLGLNYDGVSSFAPGGASRIPDGVDTDTAGDWVRNDFDLAGIPGFTGTLGVGEALNTPGAPNVAYAPPPEACGDPYTAISAVQGNGATSPFDGIEVAIEGIVVGDFQPGPDDLHLRGFHVQSPDSEADADPATSEGVFVYAPTAADVNVGDRVRVRGTVDEYNGLTELTGVAPVWTCSSGNALPTATVLSLPVTSLDEFESVEGMLVTFPQDLVISEFFNFDRYGEIVLTDARQYQPTAVFEPGSSEAAALATANSLGRITLDDGRSTQNPDPAIHPNGSEFTLDNRFRGGDTVANVTGVMDYSFGLYRIQPTEGADYTAVNARPDSPATVGGNVKVASFNVLNYFTTLNSRGANTPEEFSRQRDKIIAALLEMDADVVGLIEIENNDAAIADLVDGLNTAADGSTYAYVDTGVVGTDEIKQAFIYKPESVETVGDFAVLDSSVDPGFIDTKNRPALAQTFRALDTGGVFTVAVNHLKSKGSACDDVGDPDLGDGAGNCNLTREAAAMALVDWLESDPTGSGDSDFLIMGDLNSYDKEDPIDALLAGGYTDLVASFGGENAYSYLFDGQLGHLDHALASPGLVGDVAGTTVWHINADEPDILDYDMTFKADAQDALYEPNAFRSSDHDPVIVGLDVCDEVAPTVEVSVTPDVLWPANHKYVTVKATVTASDDVDPDPTVSLVSVTSSEPDNGAGDGNTVNDAVTVDDTTFRLRAERSGTGTGRVYTITYRVTDACGNESTASATVTVPLSRGR